jgi:ORF6N domain.
VVRIFGLTTSRFNAVVERNRHRFPADFRFQLTRSEWEIIQALRSQNAILNRAGRGQHRKYLPYTFTEHGALMAANVLNSLTAVSDQY